jgi:hypothetical protein
MQKRLEEDEIQRQKERQEFLEEYKIQRQKEMLKFKGRRSKSWNLFGTLFGT